jgi:hypothetical protein
MKPAARIVSAAILVLLVGFAPGCIVAKTGAKVGTAAVKTTGKVAGATVGAVIPDQPDPEKAEADKSGK